MRLVLPGELPFPGGRLLYLLHYHPEMSAVVVALTTPLYAIADSAGAIDIHTSPRVNTNVYLGRGCATARPRSPDSSRITLVQHGGDLGLVSVPICTASRYCAHNKIRPTRTIRTPSRLN